MPRAVSRVVVPATIFALLAAVQPPIVAQVGAQQAAGDVFISEFHYDNTGTDAGEFVEVTAPAGTDLTGWSIVLYNGSNGAVYDTAVLSGTVADQAAGYGAIVIDYPSNGIQNGAPDGIALVDDASSLVEFLSYEGAFTAVGGAANGVSSTNVGVQEPGTAPFAASISRTGNVPAGYTWLYGTSNSKGVTNPGLVVNGTPLPSPVLVTCGGALTVLQGESATRMVTARDADGTVVDIDIVVDPPTTAITIGATTPASGAGGTASATVTVADDAALGTYEVAVTATNADAEPQTGTCTLAVSIVDVLTIGEVQGQTTDAESGTGDVSPYRNETVYVRGVVTQRIRYNVSPSASNPDGRQFGFFLQSTIADADGDPLTSDGIFVWHDRFTTLLAAEGGPSYFPEVGDQVVLRGLVVESFNLTQLSDPRLVSLERTDDDAVDLDTEVAWTDADPADELAEANRFWERHEGMLFSLEAGAQVVAARDVFPSSADGEVWVVNADHDLLDRTDPYSRLVYRDAHPLDPAGADEPDGNGMRIMLSSHGLKWLLNDPTKLIAPANTYDTVTNELTGGLYYAFGKYSIQVQQQLVLSAGVDPALNAPPAPAEAGVEFATSDYNVENLYDFRDDPNDGCDFADDDGCPGVDPPFDYVPASEAAYEAHLADLAGQIAGPMHAPDILMIQEAEDQDVCSIVAGELACDLSGDTDNADGRPDTLQDLALAIAALGGPVYDTAYDRDGADDRGIVSAFMYRTDRVELLPVDDGDPVLGSTTGIDYLTAGLDYNSDVDNPKAVNAVLPAFARSGSDRCDVVSVDRFCVYTRDPQVGHFRVWRDGIGVSVFTDLWVISNHFSSTPDRRVAQRREQAAYQAAIVAAITDADPAARVISGGDFNVYPRPDDPFFGGSESDQLGPMYEAGLENLFDTLVAEVPQSAYSYSFQGQAQTLDMQWANDTQFADLVQVRAAHLNADFAADHSGDAARGASDHDPQVARWFTDVTFDRLEELARYFGETGDIHQPSQAAALAARLDRAENLLDRGKIAAFDDQVEAFIDQVEDWTPDQIDPLAAAALLDELERLLQSLG